MKTNTTPQRIRAAATACCSALHHWSATGAGACGLLLVIAGAVNLAHADPVVTSNFVGFTSLTINPGYNAVSVSLLNLDKLTGRVATPGGSSGNVLTTTGAGTNLGASLNSAKQYYLEVVGEGTSHLGYVGERFEVNVAATIAAANNTLTLQGSSPTNTMTQVPDLSDYLFVVREHITIAQVFGGAGNVKLSGSGLVSSSDQILFYDNATNAFQAYWFRANASGTNVSWRSVNDADTTDYSNMAIRPGVGLFVYRQPSAGTITLSMTGALRTTSFRQPLPAGYSLVSPPAPMAHSPAAADMVTGNGWTGSGIASASDQVHLWTGTSFNGYWFRANASGTVQEWRDTNDSDPTNHMNDSAFFKSGKAIFVRKLQADPQYIENILNQ